MKKIIYSALLLFPLSSFSQPIISLSSCQDLQNIQNNLSAQYQLAQNIDCSDFAWAPISGVFTGSLSGKSVTGMQSYRIRNLTIDNIEAVAGIFERLENATIENITFEDIYVNFSANSKRADDSVGFVTNEAVKSTFKNVTLNSIYMSAENAHAAGLLVGEGKNLKIDHVIVDDSYFVTSAKYAGLIIGSIRNDRFTNVNGITNSQVLSSYIVNDNPTIQSAYGGIAGYSEQTLFEHNSVMNVSIGYSSNLNYAGGLSGFADFTDSMAKKNHIDETRMYAQVAGGLFGQVRVNLEGSVSGITQNAVENASLIASQTGGGLIGKAVFIGRFSNACYVSDNAVQYGVVNGYQNVKNGVAGFIGAIEKMQNANLDNVLIAHNNVISFAHADTLQRAGFIYALPQDANLPRFEANFWNIEIAGAINSFGDNSNHPGVQGLNIEQLHDSGLYLSNGWDFRSTWYMSDKFVRLRWLGA